MEELGIPELSDHQSEELCSIAEEAARKYVYSKVPKKGIEELIICAEITGAKPVNLEVDIDIVLASSPDDLNLQKLANDAVKNAFGQARKYLELLTCPSQK